MIHYKIKVQGIANQWEADSFHAAQILAGKVWSAMRLDNIYIDEYYNNQPTGVWYRRDGMNYIKNSVETN